jgi:hypothetical protein
LEVAVPAALLYHSISQHMAGATTAFSTPLPLNPRRSDQFSTSLKASINTTGS